jgi:hypothetical protein
VGCAGCGHRYTRPGAPPIARTSAPLRVRRFRAGRRVIGAARPSPAAPEVTTPPVDSAAKPAEGTPSQDGGTTTSAVKSDEG